MPAFFFTLSSLCLAAALFFLARELAALRPGRAALACALAAGAAWLLLSASVPVRGGYDNEHDFSALSINPRNIFGAGEVKLTKELSPLVTDAAANLLSGNSLAAVLWKNRLLTLASGAALGLAGCALGGAAAGAVAAFLYLFNFLLVLNSSSMASTGANLFFFASSACAPSFYLRGGRPGQFYWSLASLWLLAAGRVELALFPLAVFLALWLYKSARRLAAGRPDGRFAAELVCVAAFLGCFFLLKLWLSSVTSYNGPAAREFFRWPANLEYQLGLANLAVFAPALKGLAGWLAAAAALTGLALAASGPRGGRLGGAAVYAGLALWVAYMAVIFMPLDRYPLHFMRHQAYFFLPAALLFGLALSLAARLAPGRRFLAAGAACALALAYAELNYRAARALDGALRTNDIEWQVLLEASKKLAPGCAVVYPEPDDIRHDLLARYFRLAETERALAGSCFVKYLPPVYQIPSAKYKKFILGYNPAAAGYVGEKEEPVFGRSFTHRFYSIWDGPNSARPVRLGFYPAQTPADKAWLLNFSAGLDPFDGGAAAEKKLLSAVALDPACDACRYGLALRLALRGDSLGSAGQLDALIKRGMLKDKELLASGISRIAAGDPAGAVSELEAFRNSGSAEMFYLSLIARDLSGLFTALNAAGQPARRPVPAAATGS
jgi:hypothetical protein